MEIAAFLAIVGSARSDAARSGQPFDEILTDTLAARPRPDILYPVRAGGPWLWSTLVLS